MKHLLLACCLLFVGSIATAQEEKETQKKVLPSQKGVFLNTTLSSLTEPEGGPSLGLEYRFSETVAVGLDATALLYVLPDTYEDSRDRRGFRVRPEIKFFPSFWQKEHRSFYVSLMGLYKEIRYNEQFYSFDGTNTNMYTVRQKKAVSALSANMGVQRYVGPDRRILIELYAGCGFRHRRTTPGDPYDSYRDTDRFLRLSIDEDGYSPSFAFGFKLGYRL
ncbi:hypothetical protein [Chitinophaga agri]|uniref:DUF3575 domain-containing protein n=1 Tax=Chitinophaga agri TaxID=2703787 RepID=A0A6B9ZI28_9BACT|nr:hypothetical protein [Chitinophaga agri]QHS60243.1 hypothetical protein GWR21_11720 [Chitinophaga agri]